jgi:hypothetical protein
LLRSVAALCDFAVGEPLHFAMVRKMMLGIKRRAERSTTCTPSVFEAAVV